MRVVRERTFNYVGDGIVVNRTEAVGGTSVMLRRADELTVFESIAYQRFAEC